MVKISDDGQFIVMGAATFRKDALMLATVMGNGNVVLHIQVSEEDYIEQELCGTSIDMLHSLNTLLIHG